MIVKRLSHRALGVKSAIMETPVDGQETQRPLNMLDKRPQAALVVAKIEM